MKQPTKPYHARNVAQARIKATIEWELTRLRDENIKLHAALGRIYRDADALSWQEIKEIAERAMLP